MLYFFQEVMGTITSVARRFLKRLSSSMIKDNSSRSGPPAWDSRTWRCGQPPQAKTQWSLLTSISLACRLSMWRTRRIQECTKVWVRRKPWLSETRTTPTTAIDSASHLRLSKPMTVSINSGMWLLTTSCQMALPSSHQLRLKTTHSLVRKVIQRSPLKSGTKAWTLTTRGKAFKFKPISQNYS